MSTTANVVTGDWQLGHKGVPTVQRQYEQVCATPITARDLVEHGLPKVCAQIDFALLDKVKAYLKELQATHGQDVILHSNSPTGDHEIVADVLAQAEVLEKAVAPYRKEAQKK